MSVQKTLKKYLKSPLLIGVIFSAFAFFSYLAEITPWSKVYSNGQMYDDISIFSEKALKRLNIQIQGGGGSAARVGVDGIWINIKINEENKIRLIEKAIEAQEAVSLALAKSRILWNMTNHGPNSLSLVHLNVDTLDKDFSVLQRTSWVKL